MLDSFMPLRKKLTTAVQGITLVIMRKKKFNFQGKIKKESSIYDYIFRDSEMINLFG